VNERLKYRSLLPMYAALLTSVFLIAMAGSRAVTVMTVNAPVEGRKTVIIDAGHGGIDGGAVSCTGVYESKLNLDIALKLDDLMHLLGINTVMIRQTDCSVYTKGETIAQKKISDLKERVRIVNSTPDAVLISIHQNHFTDSRYSGAQVFYAQTDGSKKLAESLQSAFIQTVNPTSNRRIKKSDGIYLMQHVQCPAALIECGFISNTNEEYKLRTKAYQQKICSVVACTVSNYLFAT